MASNHPRYLLCRSIFDRDFAAMYERICVIHKAHQADNSHHLSIYEFNVFDSRGPSQITSHCLTTPWLPRIQFAAAQLCRVYQLGKTMTRQDRTHPPNTKIFCIGRHTTTSKTTSSPPPFPWTIDNLGLSSSVTRHREHPKTDSQSPLSLRQQLCTQVQIL